MQGQFKEAEPTWLPLDAALVTSSSGAQCALTNFETELRAQVGPTTVHFNRTDLKIHLDLSAPLSGVHVVFASPFSEFSDQIFRATKVLPFDARDWLQSKARDLVEALRTSLMSDLFEGRLRAYGRLREIVGTDLTPIPPDYWNYVGGINWATGVVSLIDGSSIYSVHIIPPVGYERWNDQPQRSGLPGRPSAFNTFVRPYFHALVEFAELEDSLSGTARKIADWLKIRHPNAPPMSVRSIENRIRHDYRRLHADQTEWVEAGRLHRLPGGMLDLRFVPCERDYAILGRTAELEEMKRVADVEMAKEYL